MLEHKWQPWDNIEGRPRTMLSGCQTLVKTEVFFAAHGGTLDWMPLSELCEA